MGPMIAALGWLLFTSAIAGPGRSATPVDAAAVEAVVSGYTSVRPVEPYELEVRGDAIRFRPLVIACRQLCQSINAGDLSTAAGWWSRYIEADGIVEHVLSRRA